MQRIRDFLHEAQTVSTGVLVYTAALYLSAAALLVPLTLIAPASNWLLVFGLATAAGIAERQSVALTAHTETSVSFLPVLFAAVALGPTEAAYVSGLAAFADFRPPYLRCVTYVPIRAMTGAAAGAAGAVTASGSSVSVELLTASAAASVAFLLTDSIFNVLTGIVRRVSSAGSFIRAIGPLSLLSLPFYVPLVALLAYGYSEYSLWIVAALMGAAVALQRLVQLYREERAATHDLAAANARLASANLSFAAALVATLDARDRYTAGHSAAVAIYARDIALQLGLEDNEIELAYVAGLVHDIGKVGLPAGVLEKAGPLTLAERRLMQEHSTIGERILSHVADYADIARIVRHHHERSDGNGYPDGLVGSQVPLLSRIISVADAYNAMTSNRPYREAMSSLVARRRLAEVVGAQFDPDVVTAFEVVLRSRDESYRSGHSPEFATASERVGPARHVVPVSTAA